MTTASCRSCGAPVIWARTERGRRAPIDAQPTTSGTVVLRSEPGEETPLALFGVPEAAFPEEPRYTSHFATCPDDARWRRRRGAGGGAGAGTRIGSVVFAATAVAALAFVVLTARCTADALARGGGYASAYGPGLYGNRLACGGRLRRATVAVAHRTLRCGQRLRVCYGRRCVRARVRDRGPWVGGRVLDLTEATVRRLGFRSATSWGVRFIHYEEEER